MLLSPIWCPIALERQDCFPFSSNTEFGSVPPHFHKETGIVEEEKAIVQLFLWKPPGGIRDN